MQRLRSGLSRRRLRLLQAGHQPGAARAAPISSCRCRSRGRTDVHGEVAAVTGTEIRLAARPKGWPIGRQLCDRDGRAASARGGSGARAQPVHVGRSRTCAARMNDVKSYVPPFQVGQPLEGGAIGEVDRVARARPQGRRHRPVDARAGATTSSPRPPTSASSIEASAPLSRYLGVLGNAGPHRLGRASSSPS